jgi:pseudaminic acid cytidylyltransferase
VNVAIIPARAGSKRIKHKNIKLFNGKPLIAYSIEAAIASGLFDLVIVSTDCPNIAKLSQDLGATIPFMQDQGHKIDYCCCIYATAPFVKIDYLKQGIALLKANPSTAFAFSISSFDFPIQRALKNDKNGMGPMFPDFIDSRSQDLQEAFHDAGQFYWGSATDFLSKKQLFSEHALGVKIPRYLVQDIDTIEDWRRAELMHKAYINSD